MALIVECRDLASGVIGQAGETPPRKVLAIPSPDDERFPLMRGIDPYGVTTFSSLQMQWLVPELEGLLQLAPPGDPQRLLDELIELAQLCADRPHRTLVFLGD